MAEMWRYALAGAVVVVGVLLVFFWKFGDPVSVPHSLIPTVHPTSIAPPPTAAPDRPSLTQQRQTIETGLRLQLQMLQRQMAETDKEIDRLHTRMLQITRDADFARQALSALTRAEEIDNATKAKP